MEQQKNKNYIICDECGGKMLTNIADQDSRGNIFCSNCGLVYNPGHEMGKGFSGLIDYVNHQSLNDYIDDVRLIYQTEGLAKARLMVSKL